MRIFPDRNLANPIEYIVPIRTALGDTEWQRILDEIRLYQRYDGDLNVWSDYMKPSQLDYEPTKLELNYPRKIVDTIAAWQFEKEPKVTVPPDVLDDPALMIQPGYEPSEEQQTENSRAKAKERLLTWVWDDNRMHEKLLAAAKDRSISRTGVYARIHFDNRRGEFKIIWHPSTEVIAVHNEWDKDQLDVVHFIAWLDDEQTRLWKLSYYLVWHEEAGTYDCEIEEAVHDGDLNVQESRVERSSMGLDFIPVVHVPTEKLSGRTTGYSELEKTIELSEEIDRKMSDYSDAIRFEMFAINLLVNVDEDPKNPLQIAPGAKWNLGDGDKESGVPSASKLESGFKFKETIEAYLDRLQKRLHEKAEVPIVNTADMNTGGINDMAIQLMFSSIISKTQRSWVIWQSRLQTLNEYILRYMKARVEHPRFKYDKEMLAKVDNYYSSEIIFGLPLPQDQKALIEQLGEEISNEIESIKGAITRSGKENAEQKFMEIIQERQLKRQTQDPYKE
ncbi:phage portal protein [Bacillus cereus group sp. TH253LC]|uniref:phage portal protein n=1 Tax=Bacillus cereus group sp. TH253LC TaxID=3018043 RepID=UPI0022E64D78|nr:phage portal protein [Bacillus cereus group sp. TH253LC]MDA1545852.1 phage portal protein [Bacillus cereus group sp. TH253LC]